MKIRKQIIVKKKCRMLFAAGLCFSILAGCQETPKSSIIKQKSTVQIKKYETMEIMDGDIKKIVHAPETYKNQAAYEDGRIIIDTDAEVIVPNVDTMNTYKVSAKKADQEMIDNITHVFFAGDKIYHAYDYNEWTKEQYQEDITKLKKYKAEGNLDPYNWGTYEDGTLVFNIDEAIASDEESMQNAPDEIEKKEVIPSFGLEWTDGDQTKVDENRFSGVVETDHGIYSYDIEGNDEYTADVRILIQKRKEDTADFREISGTAWKDGRIALDREYLPNDGEESSHCVSEDTIKGFLNISYEDAEEIAREKIEMLGWDWKVSGWDYSVYCRGYSIQEDNILDAGYIFYFNRMLDGALITFTDDYGGGLEEHESTLIPWSYERCEVIVGDDGIQRVEIYSPYEVEGIQTEHVNLMDFDSMIKIYEQMMEVSNADMQEYYEKTVYHVKKITLGYSRIYDPALDSATGILVPVWDFFGGCDTECEDYVDKNSGEHSKESFLTINAIDGTVINRGLGY